MWAQLLQGVLAVLFYQPWLDELPGLSGALLLVNGDDCADDDSDDGHELGSLQEIFLRRSHKLRDS